MASMTPAQTIECEPEFMVAYALNGITTRVTYSQ